MFERDGQFFENDRVKFKALKNLILADIDRTAVQSGLWSDPATWGGTVPRAGENVLIPLGKDVIYDLNAPGTALGTVLVQDGAFRVAPTLTTAIHLHTMLVHGGLLQIGKPGAPVTGKFTMTLADADFVAGDTAELGKQLLTMDARVSIMGQDKIPFARSTAGIASGQTSITLMDDVDPETGAVRHAAAEIAATWAVGDRISIPTTSSYNGGGSGSTTVGTIASISGATITLASGAKAHPALSDISNMSGAASGIRKKFTFKRTPWILNETRTILFKSANPGTNSRRGCLMFMGNHPPRSIGGHRDDLHRTYADLGPDKDPRHEFRWFAMEGLGRTLAQSNPNVGRPGNPIGRWPFHPHHIGHWAMDPVMCQGLVLTDFNMWGYTHDDSYSWYDWCIARDGVGSAFTCIMDTEQGVWTRCFAADVRSGGGGGEYVHAGHGRDGHGYTPARQILIKEIHAANCQFGLRMNQNETDPLLGGYLPNKPWSPVGRWPDREAIKRIGGWCGDYPLVKHEDPMMGNWDDFEFFSCDEGVSIFHRQVNYMSSETRSFFARWNLWRCGIAIKTANYTLNYTWRDCCFSNCSTGWSMGDKLSGFVFWNSHFADCGRGTSGIALAHNDGGGFIDITRTNVAAWHHNASIQPDFDSTVYDSANCLFATPEAAFDVANLAVDSNGNISGQIRDMLTGLVPVDATYGMGRIPLGYASQKANSAGWIRMDANNSGLNFATQKQSMTREHLVIQNGCYQSGGNWFVGIWLFMRDRMTGTVFYRYVARNVNAVSLALRQENDIGGPPPQPDYALAPDLADLPATPEAVSYLLDPVHPVTYRAVTRGADVSVILEATNRFLDRTAGNDLRVGRRLSLRDGSGAQTTAQITFDVKAVGVAPVNIKAPELTRAYVAQTNTLTRPTSSFNAPTFRLDRGRWRNTEGGWFEARLLRNDTPYTHSHHFSNANPALNRWWYIEPETFQSGRWKLEVRFNNAHGTSAWVGSNEVVIT